MILHLFAGPGGFDLGCKMAGAGEGVGIEWDDSACRTRDAAGLPTIRGDVSAQPVDVAGGEVDGLTGGPPCPTFSQAGKGDGRAQLAQIIDRVELCGAGWSDAALEGPWTDARTPLVLQPLRFVSALRPEWVALEQVPAVLPVWQAYRRVLRAWGYAAETAVLNSADYGVPQTRMRAVLVASRLRRAHLPAPSHSRHYSLFGTAPWVTMADALGWGMAGRPAFTVACGTGSGGGADFVGGSHPRSAMRAEMTAGRWLNPGRTATQPHRRLYDADSEPAPTVAFGHDAANWLWVFERPSPAIVGSFCPDVVANPVGRRGPDGTLHSRQDTPYSVRVTASEAAVLQSFPADYPFQGNKGQRFQQIANAFPPRAAAHVVAAAAGRSAPSFAHTSLVGAS